MITKRIFLGGLAASAGLPFVAYAGDNAFVRVPVTVTPTGRVHIAVTLNGQGPFTFIVDTGASTNAIRDDLAKTLKLSFLEGATVTGVGGERTKNIYQAKTILYGGKFRQKDILLAGIVRPGTDEDGLLAAGFLTSLPSELDYGLSEARIFLKGGPDLSSYIPVKSYLNGESASSSPQIYVFATIDGVPLRLLLDTGSPSALLLYPATVKTNSLWDKYGVGEAMKSTGVTGDSVGARGVIMPDFAMGDIAIPHLPVKLMDPNGHQDHMGVDGLLGAGFLKMFSMAISHTGVAFRPNAQIVISAGASASTDNAQKP